MTDSSRCSQVLFHLLTVSEDLDTLQKRFVKILVNCYFSIILEVVFDKMLCKVTIHCKFYKI